MNKDDVLAVLTEHKMSPQKQKGQNFLIDETISKRIVAQLTGNHTNVLEIGPGLGALTKHLALKYNVTAVELDRGFARYISEQYHNVVVVNNNILKYKVPRETTAAISNLPYYITTKSIEHIIIKHEHITEFVFMTESDVGLRLFANAQTKAYSPLAIVLHLFGTLTKCFDVSNKHFYPKPYVNSTVFRFVRNDNTVNIDAFYKLLKTLFASRRKTLLNNAKHLHEYKAIVAFLDYAQIDQSVRTEQLTPETLLNLYNYVNNEQKEQ